jgi:hypothetical protein
VLRQAVFDICDAIHKTFEIVLLGHIFFSNIELYLPKAITAENLDAISMIGDFEDISKYYAANIVENVLTVGKIIFKDGGYSFAPDNALSPYSLVGQSTDTTRMVHLIGEIHPRSALQKLLEVEIISCLYLNENHESGGIEARSIHKGIGSSIHIREECPLIRWNEKYEAHHYFDVVDVQHVFTEGRLKNSFIAMLAESLCESEMFLPLLHLNVSGTYDTEEQLHNPRLRG